MPFYKGHKYSGGRKKGVPNKLTRSFRDLLLNAVEGMQAEPDHNLLAWAKQNPTEFYKIAARLIPSETVTSSDDGPQKIEVVIVDPKQ